MPRTAKTILKMAFAAALFYSQTAFPLDDPLKSGLDDYNSAVYGRARSYFARAAAGPKASDRKFAEYALRKMKEFGAQFDELEAMERAFKPGTKDAPSAASLAEKHRVLAEAIIHEEFYPAFAEPHLKRAVELAPDDIAANFRLGEVYYAAARYAEAAASYEKAADLEPDDPRIYKAAADACVAAGYLDKARHFYSEAIGLSGRSHSPYSEAEIKRINAIMRNLPETYRDIDELLKNDRTEEAAALLKKRIALDGNDYLAMAALANIYIDRNDEETALGLLDRAAKIAPDYPLTHLYLGRLYFLTRRSDQAAAELKLFKEKMALFPKMDSETERVYLSGLHYLCEVYLSLKRYEEMRAEIEAMLKLDPGSQAALYNLAVYHYLYKHDKTKAYELLRKTIEMDPNTREGRQAQYTIEYIRRNPDSRVVPASPLFRTRE